MINIFYACDDRYVPFLTVSLTSLIENASDTREYNITVLHSGLSNSSIESVKKLKKNNIKIGFCNVSDKLKAIADQLELRDYYTLSIYYRIFIPELFPHLQKAVYLDADTVLLKDVACFTTPMFPALLPPPFPTQLLQAKIFLSATQTRAWAYTTANISIPA